MTHEKILSLKTELLSGCRTPSIAESVQIIETYQAAHAMAFKLERLVHKFVKETSSESAEQRMEEA